MDGFDDIISNATIVVKRGIAPWNAQMKANVVVASRWVILHGIVPEGGRF